MPTIGTIIHATHRPEDLIPAFIDALSECVEEFSLSTPNGEELRRSEIVGKIESELGAIERRTTESGYFDSDEAQYDLEWLFEELAGFAPAYCYFGAHEGDGSDFGFWISHEEIEDSVRDGFLARSSEEPNSGHLEWLEVNERGNMTLRVWNGSQWTEVWSIV